MNTQAINNSDLFNIAKELRKKVNGLLLVYFLLIAGTILFFLTVVAGAIFGVIFMVRTELVSIHIAALLFAAIVVAGVCVKVVINPLLRIFVRRDPVGTEIKRKDHPELFAVIDEIVEKAGCKFPRKVYVYSECNAYVSYRSIWGHLFNVRKNLTIGLPLIYTLNKSELKAILSHEFGHFTQKTVAINNTANLSAFICTAIAYSLQQIENADADTYAAKAQWFAKIATRIMLKQYYKVVPLNGVLSRAQEFDADTFSRSIVGSDATVSALCKTDHFSFRWDRIIGVLYNFVEQKRCPQDVYSFVKRFNERSDYFENIEISSTTLFTEPKKLIMSNILLDANTATHPLTGERCDAIRLLEPVPTVWDMAPALDYFKEDIVKKQFNEIPYNLAKVKFPDSTVFFQKGITSEEIDAAADSRYDYLQYFYTVNLFTGEDAWIDNDEHPEYEESPFTEESAVTLRKYFRDFHDLRLLEQIVDENSPERVFTYFGKEYTGVNVPIQEQRELTQRSYSKAIEVAKHCNYWLIKRVTNTEQDPYFNLMCAAVATLTDLELLEGPMQTVDNILHSNDRSTKAMEYVRAADANLRQCISYVLVKDADNNSRFSSIAECMGVQDDIIKNIYAYFNSNEIVIHAVVTSYLYIRRILADFRQLAWNKIATDLIITDKGAPVLPEFKSVAEAGSTNVVSLPENNIDTEYHKWTTISIQLMAGKTILHKVVTSLVDATYIYSTFEEYIEDAETGVKYHLLGSTIATYPKTQIIPNKCQYSFFETYPELPPEVKYINIWSGSDYYVKNLKIR